MEQALRFEALEAPKKRGRGRPRKEGPVKPKQDRAGRPSGGGDQIPRLPKDYGDSVTNEDFKQLKKWRAKQSELIRDGKLKVVPGCEYNRKEHFDLHLMTFNSSSSSSKPRTSSRSAPLASNPAANQASVPVSEFEQNLQTSFPSLREEFDYYTYSFPSITTGTAFNTTSIPGVEEEMTTGDSPFHGADVLSFEQFGDSGALEGNLGMASQLPLPLFTPLGNGFGDKMTSTNLQAPMPVDTSGLSSQQQPGQSNAPGEYEMPVENVKALQAFLASCAPSQPQDSLQGMENWQTWQPMTADSSSFLTTSTN